MHLRHTEESAPPVHDALRRVPALVDHLSIETLLHLVGNVSLSVGWQRITHTAIVVGATSANHDRSSVAVTLVAPGATGDSPVVSFHSGWPSGVDLSVTCSCAHTGTYYSTCWHVAVVGLRLLGYDPDPKGRRSGSGLDVAVSLANEADTWLGVVEQVLTMPTWSATERNEFDAVRASRNEMFARSMMLVTGRMLSDGVVPAGGAGAAGSSGKRRGDDPLLALGELVACSANSLRRWTNISAELESLLANLWAFFQAGTSARIDTFDGRRATHRNVDHDLAVLATRAAVEVTATGVVCPDAGELLARLPHTSVDSTLSLYQHTNATSPLVGRGPQAQTARHTMSERRSQAAAALEASLASLRMTHHPASKTSKARH